MTLSLSEALAAIQDEATAQNAAPAIDQANALIIEMGLDRLPATHKLELIDRVKPMVIHLANDLKRIYRIPGVQAYIEPAISPMLSRLHALANVPAD